ncbi:MAG: tyrosine-protein phosphatase [Glaciimonas sp.]|nr:tyrosine-protein phosphatase [Glaciimonas sp.]
MTNTTRYENIQNIRDLGGLVTQDGRKIATARLVRSANPGLATSADIDRLKQYDFDAVIDFRTDSEKHPSEQTFSDMFNWVADPVLVGNLSQDTVLPMLKAGTADHSRRFMLDFYRDFPVRYQTQYQRFLQRAEQNQSMLYHCTAGKDRTGFASLLLLSALGVDHDTIVADYLESNLANTANNTQVLAQVKKYGLPPATMAPLLLVEAAYLDAAIEVINNTYGGMKEYLEKILKIDTALICANYLS